jgi:hypothetical protein
MVCEKDIAESQYPDSEKEKIKEVSKNLKNVLVALRPNESEVRPASMFEGMNVQKVEAYL